MDKRFSSLLDFSRWTAALLVVVSHLRNIVFVDYENVQYKTLFVKAFYFITGLGHEAVIVFFVISGLLVGGLSLSRWKSREIDYTRYFMNRFSRIYVVLLPALIAGGIFDFIGLFYFNRTGLYSHTTEFAMATLDFSVQDRLAAASFAASVFMLQPFVIAPFGSNGPLWSLSYEWWYYCIFAILLAFFGSKTRGRKTILAIAMIGLAALLPLTLTLWMLVWLLGTGVLLYGESRLPRLPPMIALGIFVSTIIVSKFCMNIGFMHAPQRLFADFGKDFLVGAGFALLLLSFYRKKTTTVAQSFNFPLARINQCLAEFSYTTYLCHVPFMLLLLAVSADVFNQPLKQQPARAIFIYFFLVLAGIYLYVFMFSRFTERYTDMLRKRLEYWIFSSGRSAVSSDGYLGPAQE